MDHFLDFKELVHDFRESSVDFLILYIPEAHSTDGWHLFKKNAQIKKHKTLQDRLAATQNVEVRGVPCPLAMDGMDSRLTWSLQAMPERTVIINGEGRLLWKSAVRSDTAVQKTREYITSLLKQQVPRAEKTKQEQELSMHAPYKNGK